MSNEYISWGRYPNVRHGSVASVTWRSDLPDMQNLEKPVLPFARGRSYGDSCLNEDGVLLDVRQLNRFISFDRERGVLRCEAGVSLSEILGLAAPSGWFLPVLPGTRFVSVGGAVANDIHGKNHHRAGTFGCHVRRFELARSNGERLVCSPRKNSELFRATIGGLGLTGLVVWVEIQLKRIPGPSIDEERIRFASLSDFFDLSRESDEQFEYTVAWVDCLAQGDSLGRGIFIRGNHAPARDRNPRRFKPARPLTVPFDLPGFFLNRTSVRLFNELYYRAQRRPRSKARVPFDKFFFPLDSIGGWNRIYGRRGFLQYQCVVPPECEREAIAEILRRVAASGEGSFLAVLKRFGDAPSPGMLSFPEPGSTLALDFPFRGSKTLDLLDALDVIVRESGGAVYPAKDARMSAESFQAYFPKWREFTEFIDPNFTSSFWRRVAIVGGEEEAR